TREGDLPDAGEPVWRPGANNHGGAVDAAGRGAEDGEPRPDSRVPEPTQHLRRYPRAPHIEPAGMGQDQHSGRDRAGSLPGRPRPLVAVHQLVLGDMGAERLSSGISPVSRVPDSSPMPAYRRDDGFDASPV